MTQAPADRGDRPDRPRVLYCTHRVPYPPDKGDRIRNFHVLRQLAAHCEVWLACLADEPVMPDQSCALESLAERVAIIPMSGKRRWLRAGLSFLQGRSLTEGAFLEPALTQQLSAWARETRFSATICSSSSLASYLRLGGLRDTPAIVDLVDVDSQKWFDFSEATRPPKRWLFQQEGRRVRKLEQQIATWAHGITLVSKAEAAVFDAFTHPGAATTATNGVDLEYFQPSKQYPEMKSLAFVGAMDYFPNIDAAVWFAREIWPKIHTRHPDAEFHIIGRKPTAEVLNLAAVPGVRVMGTVPDVRPYVLQAALAVAPIRIARGLQNKVLEALALGKATLAAPAAIAALDVRIGDDLLSPKSADEWVTMVCQLLDDPVRRGQLGHAGRRFAEEHHHWQTCLQPLVQLLPGVADSAEEHRHEVVEHH